MTVDLRPRILQFVFQPGCGVCEASEPAFEEFLRRRPMVMALRLNASGEQANNLPMKIRATPTWIYRVGTRAAVHEGVLDIDKLLAWIDEIEAALAQ